MSRFKNQEKAAAGEENFSIHINYKIIIHNRESIDISQVDEKALATNSQYRSKILLSFKYLYSIIDWEKQKLIFVIVPPCEVRLKID